MLLFGSVSIPFVRHELLGGRSYVVMTNYILHSKKHVVGALQLFFK